MLILFMLILFVLLAAVLSGHVSLSFCLLSVLSIVPILAVWQRVQRPVQRFYLGQYVVTYLSATPIGTVAAFFKGSKEHTYHVLTQNGVGYRLKQSEWVPQAEEP